MQPLDLSVLDPSAGPADRTPRGSSPPLPFTYDIISALAPKQDCLQALKPYIRQLPPASVKRILVSGGAGFVGSHLVDKLLLMGHSVIVLDNFYTGDVANLKHWAGYSRFRFVEHDITTPFFAEVDQIYHLACPASPPQYQRDPVYTLNTCTAGTMNMLKLAKETNARILVASSSEVYGDPHEHPQNESYWGHVNPIGPRACYDEGKRISETLSYAFAQSENVDVRVVRIFNTFGPRMSPDDGRVISNFIVQALRGEDLTIYGDGSQTRCFQYVPDLVDGLIAVMEGECSQPINLGNPDECSVRALAEIVRESVKSNSRIVHLPPSTDDPRRRQPDISRAKREVGWQPRFSMQHGLQQTVEFFRQNAACGGDITR
ncbi:hypothetical protein HDU86_002223 [Geranomyces michiganensis]|nr:hypothetical protein HDU86_002223 [Geranomyces michiganensis]